MLFFKNTYRIRLLKLSFNHFQNQVLSVLRYESNLLRDSFIFVAIQSLTYDLNDYKSFIFFIFNIQIAVRLNKLNNFQFGITNEGAFYITMLRIDFLRSRLFGKKSRIFKGDRIFWLNVTRKSFFGKKITIMIIP